MNIGVDVDGVLTNLTDFQIGIGTPYFKRKYGRDVVNPNAYDVKDIFCCTDKERERFGWDRTLWRYMVRFPVRENASSVIRNLKNEGHKIYIITGRVFVTRNDFKGRVSRFLLKNWLKRRKILYDKIFFCCEHHSVRDKTIGCKKYDIDVMIEDKAENIMALSDFTKVVCFDAAYNRKCEGENIVRARDWEEVYNAITREKR